MYSYHCARGRITYLCIFTVMKWNTYTIREIHINDAPSFNNMVKKNQSRLENFFAGTVARNQNLPDTEAFIHDILQKQEKNEYYAFVIVDDTTHGLVGFMDVKNIDWRIPKAELGYFMDDAYAGKGLATGLMQTLIQELLKLHKFNKLFLRTHPANKAARSLAEKCGFEVEGILRRDYKTTSGELADLVYYGFIPADNVG